MWPYNTRRWKALRASKLALQPVCEACGSYKELEVHHRKAMSRFQREHKDERAAFPPPTMLGVFCKPCHSRLTRGETSRELTASRDWDAFLNEV